MTRIYKGYTIKKMVNITNNEIIYCAFNKNYRLVNCTAPQLRTVKAMLDYKIEACEVVETGFEFMLETLEEQRARHLKNVTEALAREKKQ